MELGTYLSVKTSKMMFILLLLFSWRDDDITVFLFNSALNTDALFVPKKLQFVIY